MQSESGVGNPIADAKSDADQSRGERAEKTVAVIASHYIAA